MWQRGIKVADGIEAADQLTLKGKMILYYGVGVGSQCSQKGPSKQKWDAEGERERGVQIHSKGQREAMSLAVKMQEGGHRLRDLDDH